MIRWICFNGSWQVTSSGITQRESDFHEQSKFFSNHFCLLWWLHAKPYGRSSIIFFRYTSLPQLKFPHWSCSENHLCVTSNLEWMSLYLKCKWKIKYHFQLKFEYQLVNYSTKIPYTNSKFFHLVFL